MENETFEIFYLDGLKPEVTAELAIQRLAELLKASVQQAEKMILTTNRVIKTGLSRDQAEKYFAILDRLGMQVEIRETRPQAETLLAQDSAPAEQVDESIEKVQPQQAQAQDRRYSAEQSSDETGRFVQVLFHGKGFEYFKIWIVNIFLTILTLGIYSAWAKVRNKQYFYGNTDIDGSRFNYTANPVAILKGRLIAVALFVIYALVNQFAPLIGLILFIVLLAFLPWIIIRSLAFNARNSVYRNIPFNFSASVGDAARVFLLWPILIPFTLGFILPFIWYKQSRFFIDSSSYGTQHFHFHAVPRDYYRIFFILLGYLVLAGLAIAGLVALVGSDPASSVIMISLMGPLSVIIYLFMFGYLAAALGNLYFNSTTLQKHGFICRLQTKKIVWLYFSNSLAIALSLGLLIPWAQVRMAAYRAQCMQLSIHGSLDEFIAAEKEHVSALGEQIGEVFDMDVSMV